MLDTKSSSSFLFALSFCQSCLQGNGYVIACVAYAYDQKMDLQLCSWSLLFKILRSITWKLTDKSGVPLNQNQNLKTFKWSMAWRYPADYDIHVLKSIRHVKRFIPQPLYEAQKRCHPNFIGEKLRQISSKRLAWGPIGVHGRTRCWTLFCHSPPASGIVLPLLVLMIIFVSFACLN